MTTEPILTVADYLRLPAVPPTAVIAYGDAPEHFGHLYLPSQGTAHPVLLLIHGGCWRDQYGLAPLGRFCATFAALGIAVWSLEYRRLGNGGGWPVTFVDIATGTDYLRTLAQRYPLDLQRVVAVGHSAGGHLALWLAARHRLPPASPLAHPDPLPLQHVIALAGIPDLVDAATRNLCGGAVIDLLGGTVAAVPERYQATSPHAHLPLGVPHHLLIGTADQAVPVVHNDGYVAAAQAQGDAVRYTVLPAIGHFELVTPGARSWSVVQDALVSAFAATAT
ncbi:MAG: alpha/beta hydrolase [Caldilineaceae bacterium]|nr:alpha/beta hydrolase [Caldilineaceae bacterium]